jgi:hypothetical protein
MEISMVGKISGCTLEALDLVLCCCGSLGASQLAEEALISSGKNPGWWFGTWFL